jgi:hypothetical protein
MVSYMGSELDDMLDSFKIRRVLERYCRGIDRRDIPLVNSVYWPEAVDDHGVWKGPGQAFGTFIIPLIAESYVATMHMIHQSNISVNGNEAAADTYCTALHRIENKDGLASELAYCRYADRFERRGIEWRIIERTVLMEHMQRFPVIELTTISVDRFRRGLTDRSDLSYRCYEKAKAPLT